MPHPLLHTVHLNERRALIEEGALTSVLPYAAVVDLDTIVSTPSALRSSHPYVVHRLPGVPSRDAVVVRCPTLKSRFLWCHVDDNHYRAHYLRFLQHEHGWNGTAIPREWHIDHVFNRARARRIQLNWVRMMLLPGPVNTSHGAGYEKGRTRSPITGTIGRDRLVDEIILAKISGVKSPRRSGPVTAELEEHARRIGDEHGLPATEVMRNVIDLLRI